MPCPGLRLSHRRLCPVRLRHGVHVVWQALLLGGALPDRPLRMRSPTYARLCDRIREAEESALAASARMVARATPRWRGGAHREGRLKQEINPCLRVLPRDGTDAADMGF